MTDHKKISEEEDDDSANNSEEDKVQSSNSVNSLSSLPDYSQEHARVESWLDEHQDFFQDYLIRKGGRGMIDAWLVAHALPPGIIKDEEDEVKVTEEVNKCTNKRTSKSSSGSGTPVRKISAHEFEKGGLVKPLVTTIDGNPTFLSPPESSSKIYGDLCLGNQIRKRSRNDVQGLNETDLIFELVKDICDDLDIRRLCHKILQNVGILTNADR